MAADHEHDRGQQIDPALRETARSCLCGAYLGAYLALVLAFGAVVFPTGGAGRVVAALAALVAVAGATCRLAVALRNRKPAAASRSQIAGGHDRS